MHLNIAEYTLIGGVTIAGFYMGRVARRLRLPSLLGYMALGVALGPSLLSLFDDELLTQLEFITELALSFVAFSIGAELKLSSLRQHGIGLVSIIFSESLTAFGLVTIAVYLFTRDWPMALVFGAMAPASAPAGTVAVIQEYRARGSLTQALYAVVGFDDGLAILIFGFAAALARSLLIREATGMNESWLPTLWMPAEEILLSVVVGGVIGFLMCRILRSLHTNRDNLIITFGAVLLATGLAAQFHLSLILTNLMLGFVLVNTRSESVVHRATAPLLEVMPLLFILFFTLAGAHLKVVALPALGLLGVIYIAARSAGLIGGARLGALIGSVEPKIKKYVGLGILSQAGVAIGLSLIVKHEFDQIGSEHAVRVGAAVITTITATCIFFEIVGPILTKFALSRAGEIPQDR